MFGTNTYSHLLYHNKMQTKEQFIFNDNYVLDYILDVGKRKNIYLYIRDGMVTLRVPANLPFEKAAEFLISKEQWIKDNLVKSQPKAHGFTEYKDGESVSLLGQEYTLSLVNADKYFKPYFSGKKIVAATSPSLSQDRLELSIKRLIDEYTVQVISQEADRLCRLTGLYPAKITVKSMQSSWGRCSSSGNISINRDIIYHSHECLEYVIIHELCHLRHMNHSDEFWDLVERYCPDRKRIRKQLNERI